MDLAVETRGLTRTFGTFKAVDGIDLAVPAGSLYGFLGPNGAGKSTTIKCLTGLLRPSAGSMRILGIDPLADPVAVKRRIGVVPEDLALFERLSGEEMLAFVAQVHGLDRPTARRGRPTCWASWISRPQARVSSRTTHTACARSWRSR
jgi:ABC-2 type transport system ATP-binding protein